MRQSHHLCRKTLTLLACLVFESIINHAFAAVSNAHDSVQVQSIRITGSMAFSADELAAQIADVKGKYLNSSQLQQLADRLTAFYHTRGRIHVRAILPPQDFSGGQVLFHIVQISDRDTQPKLTALSLLIPAAEIAAIPPAATDPLAALKNYARFWIAHDRPDLARDQLSRLFEIAPHDAQALGMLAMLQAQAGDRQGTFITLAKMREVQPNYPEILRIENVLQLTTVDRNKLQQARLLARTGHLQAALIAARALYPDGPPDNDLALEYWQWVERSPGGWQDAGKGLAELVKKHPDNPRDQLAWAIHQTSRSPIDRGALQVLISLSRESKHATEANQAWRSALMHDDPSEEHVALLRQYLAHDPQDDGVLDELNATLLALESRRRQLRDPAWQANSSGQKYLDDKDLSGAEVNFSRALALRPNNVQALGGMGIVRLRQARYDEAENYFRQALQTAPDQQQKWKALIGAARFWGFIQSSKRARETNHLESAEREAHAALNLQPNQPDALVTLGDALAANEQTEQAEQAYRQALAANAQQRDALTGLFDLYRKQGQLEALQHFIGELTGAQRELLDGLVASTQAALLREQADQLNPNLPRAQAIAWLEQAVRLDPNDPWLCLDLARRYAQQNEAGQGRILFDGLLIRQPANPEAHYAQAIFLAGLDENAAALASMDRIAPTDRTTKLVDYRRKLWVLVQTERARRLSQIREQEQAGNVLTQTENAVIGDHDLTTLVAQEWAHEGHPQHARALFERLRNETPPPDATWQLQYAQFLADQGDESVLREQLTHIDSRQLDKQQQAELASLQSASAIRIADAQLRDGNAPAAQQTLAPLQSRYPDDSALQEAVARVLAAEQRIPDAIAIYQNVVATQPNDSDARIEWLKLLMAQKQRKQMIALTEQWFTQRQPAKSDARLDLAGWLINQKAYRVAQHYVDAVLAVEPNNARALDDASHIALASGQLDLAIGELQHALAQQQTTIDDVSTLSALRPVPTNNTTTQFVITPAADPNTATSQGSEYQYKRLALMLDQDIPWLSSAIDWETRAGTPGQSQFEGQQIPFEWKAPWHDGGQWFLRSDLVRLQAGTLDCSGSYATRTFGTLRLSNANCPDLSTQQAQGTSLTAGYINDHLRADFGTTPIGFPIWNLVGGLLWKGDVGPFSWSLDASRRQDTSTLLSFAGTTDPRTGLVWGGVLATGVRAGLSLDSGGTFGFWSSFGIHQLTGTNVQTNQRERLMAGETWRVINEEDRLFSVGLTAMDWHDTQDSGEFTFGQGGYYSPQTYRSMSLPVTWAQRYINWSWIVRASIFTSWAQTNASPYYPTSPILQNQAGNPRYTASSGPGDGYSLSTAWEYQATPQLFIGSRLEIERSPYYAPNTFLFYLRYAVGAAAAQPVALPPNPVLPTSSF